MTSTCRYCERVTDFPCRSTRDMEEIGSLACTAALMLSGGGERTVNRLDSELWLHTLSDPSQDARPDILAQLAEAGLVERIEAGWARTVRGEAALAAQSR